MSPRRSFPSALPFFLPYVVPVLTFTLHYSPVAWHALIPPIFVWVFVPLLDLFIPPTNISQSHLTHPQRKILQSMPSFKLVTHLWCPTQLFLLIWGAYRVQQSVHPVRGLRLIALLWSLGLVAAGGINCSHELLHRNSRLERCLGKLLLASVLYAHFAIEHARGHHVNVATLNDPATMRYGESFYHFLPRTVLGGYRSAWRLETERLKRHALPFWTIHNEMLLFSLVQCLFCGAIYYMLGARALAVFLFQAAFSIVLLEQINAIEHYGLLRNKSSCGEYERVGPRHSWDAPYIISNYLLFKLQIHADHHLRTLPLCFLFTLNTNVRVSIRAWSMFTMLLLTFFPLYSCRCISFLCFAPERCFTSISNARVNRRKPTASTELSFAGTLALHSTTLASSNGSLAHKVSRKVAPRRFHNRC